MKRIISLLLTAAMVLTMFSIPVLVGAQDYLVEMTGATAPAGLSVLNDDTYTLTSVNGYGGKADSDESAQIIGNAGENNIYFGYTYKIMSADTASYLVLEYDVFPGENFNYFGMMTDTHANFAGTLYTTDNTDTTKKRVLERYQWNKVTVVIENTIKTSGAKLVQGTGTDASDYVAGEEKKGIHKAYTYVNGKAVYPDENGNAIGQLCPYFGYKWHNGNRWATGNAVRAAMYPSGSNVTFTGVFDNIRYYETETAPVPSLTLPVIRDGVYYDVSGNTITVYDTTAQTTADMVAAEGATVKAYTDSTHMTPLAEGAKLSAGNAVTVTDGNSVNYYTVNEQSAKTVVRQASDMAGFNACDTKLGTLTQATGVCGKAADDVSLRIDAQASDDSKSRTGFIDYNWSQIKNGNLYTSGYLATEYNFCLPSESQLFFDYIGLYTNQNSAYGIAVNQDAIVKDRWHKIFVAHDVVSKKAKMYLDGKLIKSDIASELNSATGKNTSRIFCGTSTRAEVIDSSLKAFFYVDDITTYYSAFEPVPGALPVLVSTDKYVIYNDKIIPAGDTLTSADVAAPSGGAVRAVRNGTILASDAALKIGDIVAVEDNTMSINAYTVDSGRVYHKTSDTAATTSYGNASTVEKLYGYAGKEASDESMKIKNDYQTSTTDGVTTYKTDYNAWPNLGNFIYASRKIPESRYVVLEANILPDGSENHVYYATNGHALISTTIGGLNIGEWNKFITVIDMTTYESKTYLNGKLVDTRASAFKGVDGASAIRFSINMKSWYDASRGTTIPEQDAIYNTGRPVVDDMYVYESVNYPVITVPVTLADGKNGSFTKNGDVISALKGKTVADLKAAYAADYRTTVYDKATYTVKVDNAEIADGDVFAIDAGDETYSYYDIDIYDYNEIIVDTMYYDSAANILNGSNISLAAAVEGDAVIAVAQYGAGDVLQKVDYANAADGIAEINFTLSADKAEYLKVFLWKDFSSMTPLSKEKTINLPDYEAAIACWGDSLTYGQGADYNTETYPVVLGELTGMKTYNLGVAGETATTIASRQGTYDIRLTEDVIIPESGEVEIKFAAYEDGEYAGVVTPRDQKYGRWNPCVINGVEGNLTINVNSTVWPRILNWAKFTRTTDGEAVKCSAGEKVIPEAQNIKTDINVFFTGTNNAWTSENKNGGEDPALLAELVRKQTAYANNNGKFVVIGLTSGNADRWTKENTALSEEFGDNFLDLKAYLVSERALADAGITPTETDLTDIANGHVPSSLLVSDGTHFNASGYRLIAQQVKAKLAELGYID